MYAADHDPRIRNMQCRLDRFNVSQENGEQGTGRWEGESGERGGRGRGRGRGPIHIHKGNDYIFNK